MGRHGAGLAFVVAGLVWEVEEEVCYGIAVVIEEGCKVGDWSLNRVVVGVDAEGVIAGVALGRRGFGLPVLALRVQEAHLDCSRCCRPF